MKHTNYKKLATSSTLEGINKLINQYFYSDIEIKESSIITGNRSKFYDLYNKKGLIESFIVMQDKRFNFLIKQ